MHTRPGGCDSGCGESDKVKKRNYVPFFNTRLYHSLRRLSSMPRYLPVCEGMIPTESRMREIRTSGSTSGGWNRVYGRRSKHRRESVWRTPRTLRAPRQPSTLPQAVGIVDLVRDHLVTEACEDVYRLEALHNTRGRAVVL